MSAIAIIPARGGSKGIPGKNLKELGGLSLLARTILAAQKSTCITKVYVTSDDEDILACARHYGAQTIQRPDTLSEDQSSSESALIHALSTIEKQRSLPEHFFFLQCTSPFLWSQDLDQAYDSFISNKADTLFSASRFHHFIWRNIPQSSEGINHNKAKRMRRQEREPEYLENGALYLMQTQGFLQRQHRFFGHTLPFEMPQLRSLEIDTPEDFSTAQMLLPLVENDLLPSLLMNYNALVTDFDGVLTDNKVHLDENGLETVRCDRGDGMGLSALLKANIPVLVLSSEQNPVVKHRCDKIGVQSIQTKDSKDKVLTKWASEKSIDLNQVVYVGNDINDLAAFAVAGCALAVMDAHPTVLQRANHIIPALGGHGAIRKVCDALLSKRSL